VLSNLKAVAVMAWTSGTAGGVSPFDRC